MPDGMTPPTLAGDAAVDGPESLTVALAGKPFRVAEKVGGLALMRFAKTAQAGVDSNELAGLAAMYDLLRQVIHPGDWQAFEAHADEQRVGADELLQAVFDAMEAISGRPTSRPSVSSDGPSTTSGSSSGVSSSVVIDLERQGRPDLALIASQADASRRSA